MSDFDQMLVEAAVPVLKSVIVECEADFHHRADVMLRDAITSMVSKGETSVKGFVGATSTMTSGRENVFGLAMVLKKALDAFLVVYTELYLTVCPVCDQELKDPASDLLEHTRLHVFEAQYPDVDLKSGVHTCEACDDSVVALSAIEAAYFHEAHLNLHTVEARLAALRVNVEICGGARSNSEDNEREEEQ